MEGKAILREVLNRRLPRQTMKKRKQGFAVPLRDWFRDGLSDFVGDYLQYDGGCLPPGVCSPTAVDRMLKQHKDGVADHGRKIWLLLSLAAWHELNQSHATTNITDAATVLDTAQPT